MVEALFGSQGFVDKVGESRFNKVKDRQIKKFQNLVNKKQGNITWSHNNSNLNNNNPNPPQTASNTNRQAGAPPLPSREGSNTPQLGLSLPPGGREPKHIHHNPYSTIPGSTSTSFPGS